MGRHSVRIIAIFLFYSSALPLWAQTANYPKDHFRSPLDIPLSLSGNFGEIRPNHFHSGLDLRTNSREGLNVYAIGDGYISRIKVSPYGYGKALYITHPNGYVSVYGHLSAYSGAVAQYVKKMQYEKESFEIEVFPGKDELKVTKGQVIALSGNTGSSGGPHLHFEIRDEKTEAALNPQLFGFKVPDQVKPRIKNIAIYPVDSESTVNGKKSKKILPVNFKNEKHSISAPELPVVSGNIGFAIETIDGENNSPGPNGTYRVELFVDNARIYSHEFETFRFDQTRFVNAHVDYAEKRSSGRALQRSFLLPNNRLTIYKGIDNNGVITFNDSLRHVIKYVVTDISGNSSSVELKVKSKPIKTAPAQSITLPVDPGVFYFVRDNHFITDHVRVDLPSEALYENISFKHSMSRDTLKGAIAPVHHIHSEQVPVHKPYTLSIKTEQLVHSKQSKALVVSVHGKKLTAEGGEYLDGWITAQPKVFGKYTVVLDTVKPVIKELSLAKDMSKSKSISFAVSDDLSGVKKYRMTIDDKWVMLEYEPKQSLLYYVFDEHVTRGEHELVLEVTDDRGNIARKEYKFKR